MSSNVNGCFPLDDGLGEGVCARMAEEKMQTAAKNLDFIAVAIVNCDESGATLFLRFGNSEIQMRREN
jgi:hypothetical protein